MLCHFSCVPLCYLRTTARQAPLSMGFLRQDHWRGLPLPPPGDLPDPGMEPASPTAPALAGRFFATVPPGKPQFWSKRIHVHSLRPASQALYPLGFISPRIVRKLGPEEAGFCHCWLGGGTLSWSESGARTPSSELQPDRTQGRRHGEREDAIQHCVGLSLSLSLSTSQSPAGRRPWRPSAAWPAST